MIKLDSLQIALFFNSLNLSNKLEYSSNLIAKSNDVFDGEPAILPIPDDAPPEIPRVILKSKDEKFVCNTSLHRMDLFFNPKEDSEKEIDNFKTELFELLLKVTSFLHKDMKVNISRLGIISNILVALDGSSNEYVVNKYLKEDGLIKKTYQAGLNFLTKRTLLDKYEVNSWIRIKTAREIKDPNNDNFLRVAIDINTLPELDYAIDESIVSELVDEALKETSSIIGAHYGKN